MHRLGHEPEDVFHTTTYLGLAFVVHSLFFDQRVRFCSSLVNLVLNVRRDYVEQEDTREVIDIVKLNVEIERIVAREQVLRAEIAKIIAELEG